MNSDEKNINDIVNFYKNDKLLKYELEGFKQQVQNFFLGWPGFVVHAAWSGKGKNAGNANFCVHEFNEIGNMETQEEAAKAVCTWEK